jgi:hypothetical protein
MGYYRFGTRQILFKLETTEGVDPIPTGAANALLTFEADLSIETDTPSRMPDRAYFTSEDKIDVGGRAKISFQADLLGAATAGTSAPISPLMQGCGFAEVLSAALTTPAGLGAAAVGSGGTFAAGTYYWKITFINLVGETVGSAEVNATLVLNGSANLTWTAPPAGATGVKVYRGTAIGAENVLVTTLAGTAVNYTDTGSAGTTGQSPPATNTTAMTQYTPITLNILSATFYFYQGGMLWKANGARGDIVITRDPNNFAKAVFTFTGTYDLANPVSQAAIPAVTLTAFRNSPPLLPTNWLVSLNGVLVECVKHEVKLNNAVNYIPTSENARVLITDRKVEGVLSVLLPDITAINPYALSYARTRVPILDSVNGGLSLNSVMSMPTCQLMVPKKNNNLKGGIQIDINYVAYPNLGNDEIVFALG